MQLAPGTLTAAPSANELYGTDYYRVHLIVFSQQPRGTAVEEAVYSDRLLGEDPEALLRFSNIDYAAPAWFVRPEEQEPASIVLFEDEEPPDDALEATSTLRIDESAAVNAADRAVPAGAADAGATMPGDANGEPLTPEARRALALATAERGLAERIELDRQTLAAQVLSFDDALAQPDRFALNSALSRIERGPGMRVLFAGSWLMEPTARDALAPLWLQLPETGLAVRAESDLEQSPRAVLPRRGSRTPAAADNTFGLAALTAPEPEALPRHPLEGTIAISKGRYLHAALTLVFDDPLAPRETVEADLTPGATGAADAALDDTVPDRPVDGADLRAPLTPAIPVMPPAAEPPLPDAAVEAAPTLVHLAQRRRMKSGELHYIDHPRLGVLIRIDPIEVPEETAAALAQVAALERLTDQK